MKIDIPQGSAPTNDTEALVLSGLLDMTSTSRDRRFGFYIPIHSQLCIELFGWNYKKAICELSRRGLVEVNNKYSAGRFPKSYRLKDRWRLPFTEEYTLRKGNRKLRIRIEQDDEIGNLLVQKFNQFYLPEVAQGWDGFNGRQIQRADYYAVRCKYGRLHTSFTGLKRESRTRLQTIDNQHLIEIDVVNCQPLLAGVIVKQNVQSTSTICWDMRSENFIELCSKGQVYETLLEEIRRTMSYRDLLTGSPYQERYRHRPVNRKDVKNQFLIMMFAENDTMRKMPIFQYVRKLWPVIAKAIQEIKEHQYQKLAWDCQRFESKIMIDGVCSRVFRTSPETILITIHDGILTTADKSELVHECIRREFSQFGIVPTVNEKILDISPSIANN